jgi:hypothetical protein
VCGGVEKMADAAAEMEDGGMVRTLKDLFAGAAGGIAQVLLGESHGSFLILAQSSIVPMFNITCITEGGEGRSTSVLLFFSLCFIVHHLTLLKGASSIYVSSSLSLGLSLDFTKP